MNNTKNNVAIAIAVIAVVIAIVACFLPTVSGPAAGQAGSRFPSGVTIGSANYGATNLALVKTGTCNAAMTTTLAATSSAAATCAVTGALTGDIVVVTLPQGGAVAAGFGGFVVSGTKATTDTVTFNIFNETGAATSSFPLATTSVQYQVYRTQ